MRDRDHSFICSPLSSTFKTVLLPDWMDCGQGLPPTVPQSFTCFTNLVQLHWYWKTGILGFNVEEVYFSRCTVIISRNETQGTSHRIHH